LQGPPDKANPFEADELSLRLACRLGFGRLLSARYAARMGSTDEHVTVDDFLHVVRCHVVSAYDYMARPE
jgi:hypothetical protein